MKRDYGFTLIELLMAIVVGGILLAIAVPSFQSFVLNDRDIGQVNSLVSSFNYARSEAVKKASPTGITVQCRPQSGPPGTNSLFRGVGPREFDRAQE